MEIFERIKVLRKDYLNISQTEFGERLGVSRSVINNIERNVLSKPEQKSSLMNLICREFNVSEKWLFDGDGPVFLDTPTSVMESLRQEFSLDDFAYNLVYEYLKLDESERKTIRDFFYRVVNQEEGIDLVSEAPGTPEELEAMFPPVEGSDSETG